MLRGLCRKQSMSSICKPLLDTREYRVVTLANKLEALLISDPKADKAAAAMDVAVGSLFDPPRWQGLAHFLEHMLFLGTAKFPAEDEYPSYLAKHGGMSNAFTADNHTCYFFSVAPDHLEGAIDRFGQFFIAPLLSQDCTDRELNAVHSEHSKNVQEDMWRQYQLMRDFAFHPQHPAHHFSTGNKETLGSVPRDVLLDFHQKWYSSNNSKVSILGRQSLDQLEQIVQGVFGPVVNKNVTVPRGDEFCTFGDKFAPHINPECIGKLLTIVPVKEQRILQFNWFLPEQTELWKTKPARYLSHILGHEGPGSLTQVLKTKGVLTDLSAGLAYDSAGIAVFKLDLHLTKEAVDQIAAKDGILAEISQLVAQYIALAQAGQSEALWKEVEVVDNLGFVFKATTDPMTAVQTAANALHYYPGEEVLAGPARIYQYDAEAIRAHLAALRPDNMYMCLIGKEFASLSLQTEKWYGTKFGIQEIAPNVLQAFLSTKAEANLQMPQENPFLPQDLSVLPPSFVKDPEVIAANLFYKQDDQFGMPKGNAAFSIYSSFVQGGITNHVSSDLFIEAFSEHFSKIAYPAEIAGLKYKLRTTREGFAFTVGGYSAKLQILVDMVVDRLQAFTVTPELFALVKDRSVRQLQSQLQQKAPYSQAIDLGHQILLQPYYSTSEKLAAVQQMKRSDLPASNSLFDNAEGLVEGNFTSEQAKNISESINKMTKFRKDVLGFAKSMKLHDTLIARRRGVNAEETNGAVAVNIETGWLAGTVEDSNLVDLKTSALLSVVSQISGQKFFDDLRTKQQLGYIVHAASMIQERRAGMLFLVQSEVPTETVHAKIQTFIDNLDSIITDITDEDFSQYIEAVVTEFKEKPKNQAEEFQRHWAEIEKRRFDFQRKERLIPVVKAITKQELVQFVREHLQSAPKVVTIITGANEPEAKEILTNLEIQNIKTDPQTKWVASNDKPVCGKCDGVSKI